MQALGVRKEDLKSVATCLRQALEMLEDAGVSDSRIISKYVEYEVASRLANKGHFVQILQKRAKTGSDICLSKGKDEQIRVEVKSGQWTLDEKSGKNYACASFGRGRQIDWKERGKFDYCVFVPYKNAREELEFLIFCREQLRDVAKIGHPNFCDHKETNPCLLVRSSDFSDLKTLLRVYDDKPLEIERKIHGHPKDYHDWSMIH
jgi:hypothetical protein